MATNNISQILGQTREVMFEDASNAGSVGEFTIEHVVNLIMKMDSRLSHIETYVKKIDDVQASLNSLGVKVTKLEDDIKTVNAENKVLESSLQGISNLYDNVKTKCDQNRIDIVKANSAINDTAKGTKHIKDDNYKVTA